MGLQSPSDCLSFVYKFLKMVSFQGSLNLVSVGLGFLRLTFSFSVEQGVYPPYQTGSTRTHPRVLPRPDGVVPYTKELGISSDWSWTEFLFNRGFRRHRGRKRQRWSDILERFTDFPSVLIGCLDFGVPIGS